MKSLFVAAAALAVVAAAGRQVQAQEFTASGTWSAGKRNGTWEATLTSEAEVIHGQVRLTGAPVLTADVAGTVRGTDIEFAVVSGQQEIATFTGSVTAAGLGGALTMDGIQGKWSGTLAAVPRPDAPIVEALPGMVAAPFDAPSDRTLGAGNICDLLTNGRAGVLSGGGLNALQAGCSGAGAAGSGPRGATTSIGCDPGPPESNPPRPQTVTGMLVNTLTRPSQTWPHITQSEPNGVVSIVDANRQVVSYNDSQFLNALVDAGGIGYGYLRQPNGPWTQNERQPVLTNVGLGSVFPLADPSGAAARDGFFRTAYIGLTLVGGPLVYAEVSAIGISQSRYEDGSEFLLSTPAIPFDPSLQLSRDKEWLAIDWTSNLGQNTQYLCWTDFDSSGSTQIKFARRRPNDDHFEPRPDFVPISSVHAYPDVVQGCQVAVAPDSSVYVIWWEEITAWGTPLSLIRGKRSVDGITFPGQSFLATPQPWFQKPTDAVATADCGTPALNGHIRVVPFPSLAVNHQTGALYIAFTRRSSQGLAEIAFVRSTDQGASWSSQVVVNDSPNGDKFMPAVAYSVAQGTLKVMWYDRRNDPANVSIDVYEASSTDGGGTFQANRRLTTAAFGVPHLWPQNFDCAPADRFNYTACYMGDYNSLASQDPSIAFQHAWGDNSEKFADPDQGNLEVPDPDIRALGGC